MISLTALLSACAITEDDTDGQTQNNTAINTNPAFSDFTKVLDGKTRKSTLSQDDDSQDIYTTRLIQKEVVAYIDRQNESENSAASNNPDLGLSAQEILEHECSATWDNVKWSRVKYGPCTTRICAANDPYEGHYNYGVTRILASTNWTASDYQAPMPSKPTSYNINFTYYQDYGYTRYNNTLCTLNVTAFGNSVTCYDNAEVQENIDVEQATNAIFSSLSRYQRSATSLHGECEK